MGAIDLESFGPTKPRVSPRLLAPGMAQFAENCKLTSGSLSSWLQRSAVYTPQITGVPTSLYLFGEHGAQYWLAWAERVSAVRAPVAGDETERTYFSGLDAPRATDGTLVVAGAGAAYPTQSYLLGVPAPTTAPGVAATALTDAAATAALTGDAVTSVTASAGGTFYSSTPTVTFTGGGGTGAAATAVVTDGAVTGVTVTAGGSGYTSPPTVSFTRTTTPTARAYVYTMVTGWGEEGPPSDPSAVLPTVHPTQIVTIDGFAAIPAGDYNITHRRIYRSDSSASGAAFELVTTIPIATTSYADVILDEALGVTLDSEDNDPPPADLHSLVVLPNGTLAGLSGNEVCFSRPGYPHAWPVGYRKTLETPGVALGVYDATVIVGTHGRPYAVLCNDPATASAVPLRVRQACASARGIVQTEAGVAFASPDGLVHITGAGVEMLTEGVYTREQWQAMAPSSMKVFYQDGMYFIFYRTGYSSAGVEQGAGIILHPKVGAVSLPFFAHGGYSDLRYDALYLIVYDEAASAYVIEEWEGSPQRETFTWQSGDLPHPRPTNMAVAMVVWADMTAAELAAADAAYEAAVAWNAALDEFDYGDSGPIGADMVAEVAVADGKELEDVPAANPSASVTFELYGDDVLRATKAVTNSHPFTLPGGYNATVWSVRLTGNRDVRAVHVATTMRELTGL